MATQKLTPQEQLARCKMRALSEGTRIWRLEGGLAPRYVAPSSTEAGVAYEIIVHSAQAGDISCNCKGAENGRYCKHLGAVLLRLDVDAAMELARTRRSNEQLERDIAELYS